MEQSSIWYLENIDVRGILCPMKLQADPPGVSHRAYNRGDFIYMPEDHSDRLYFINDGRVKIGHYGEGGKELTKAILTRGEIFGELTLVGQKRRRDFAQALDRVEICEIERDAVKNLLKEHSDLSLFFMKLLGSRTLLMEQRLESLIFKDSRSRIIEFLLQLVERRGERVGYEHVVRKFLTHQEIANMTATSRQTVTTVLNELRNAQLLTFDRRRLLIRDLETLRDQLSPV